MSVSSDPDHQTSGGFPEDVFEDLASVENGHFWFEERNALIIWALDRFAPSAQSLLEVGCGTGFVLQALHRARPALRLSGTDALPGGLAIARRRVPGATLAHQDARDLNAVDAYDVVCAFDVLEHIPDDQAALDRLSTAVTPGGLLLVTVPQHPQLWSRADDLGHHVRRYRRQELITRVIRAGFEPIRVTSFVSVLLPLLAVSRWFDDRNADDVRRNRETRPPPFLNGLLRLALTVERSAIRAGMNWPVGGSLLVAARRAAPTKADGG